MEEQEQLIDVREAMDEIAWRFHCAESAIGIRAQDPMPSRVGGVYDEKASHESHMRHREGPHRWAVNRMRAVDKTLWVLSPAAREAITLAFSPSGRVSQRVASYFEVSFGTQRASILGWALRSQAMLAAWRSHHGDVAMPDQDKILTMLEKGSVDVLKGIMRGARAELQPFLEEYEEARQCRLVLERQERERIRRIREAYVQERIQATRERLWGKP